MPATRVSYYLYSYILNNFSTNNDIYENIVIPLDIPLQPPNVSRIALVASIIDTCRYRNGLDVLLKKLIDLTSDKTAFAELTFQGEGKVAVFVCNEFSSHFASEDWPNVLFIKETTNEPLKSCMVKVSNFLDRSKALIIIRDNFSLEMSTDKIFGSSFLPISIPESFALARQLPCYFFFAKGISRPSYFDELGVVTQFSDWADLCQKFLPLVTELTRENSRLSSGPAIMDSKFDVFVSYNPKDYSSAQGIIDKLKKSGIAPWINTEQIIPDQSSQQALEDQVKECSCIIFFIGPSGLSPSQEKELELANTFAAKVHKTIFGVFLADTQLSTNDLPPLLVTNQSVDFRIKAPDPMQKLIQGIRATGNQLNHGVSQKKVFISYSRLDCTEVNRLKEALEEHNIAVTIDTESVKGGEDIKKFIENAIVGTEVTLSIISNESLLSGWVAMETVDTFFYAKFKDNKKFIPCYLDDDFLNRDFTSKATEKIDGEIQKIESLMLKHTNLKIDTGDLNAEKTRLFDLRNNLNKIIRKLRSSDCIDIRGDQFKANLPKIIKSINE